MEADALESEYFEQAIEAAEQRLGLSGHSRVVVFHEKQGRMHAHCVWSRLYADPETGKLKAKNLPFDRVRLQELSKELYLQHGWKLPKRLEQQEITSEQKYTRAEWLQFKRSGVDPEYDKAAIRKAYEASNNLDELKDRLKKAGFLLCNGKRSFLALNMQTLEPTALTRATGQRIKAIKEKCGDGKSLPSLESVKGEALEKRSASIDKLITDTKTTHAKELAPFKKLRDGLVAKQRTERLKLKQIQYWAEENLEKHRATEFKKGIRRFFDKVTGKERRTRNRHAEERDVQKRKRQRKRSVSEKII